jgi:hypothetical protein
MRRHFLPTSVLIGLIASIAAITATADAQPKKKGADTAAPAGPEFDGKAAAAAINDLSLAKCKATNAPKGEGHVTLTFESGGSVSDAKVDGGPWLNTPVAKCMSKEFKKVKVAAFKGDPVTVGKKFKFGE